MFQTAESAGNVEQYAILDDILERAAEVIVAQSTPAHALIEAKAILSRKVQEVTELAHRYIARRQ